MQRDLFVEYAVEVRTQSRYRLLQSVYLTQRDARHLKGVEPEEDAQHRDDRRERDRREEVEEDIPPQLRTIRRHKTTQYTMYFYAREHTSVFVGQRVLWGYRTARG